MHKLCYYCFAFAVAVTVEAYISSNDVPRSDSQQHTNKNDQDTTAGLSSPTTSPPPPPPPASSSFTVSGKLTTFVHEFKDGVDVEYCVLTAQDDDRDESATRSFVIELDGAVMACHQGHSGAFTLTANVGTQLSKDSDGCDVRYLPLCVEQSFHLVASRETTLQQSKSASSKLTKISGSQTVLFVLLGYQDLSPSCGTSCIQKNMWGVPYSVDGLYNEASFGATRFFQSDSTIVSVAIASKVSDFNYCTASGPQKTLQDTLAALAQQHPEIAVGNYQHMVMYAPSLCGVALSQTPGTVVWINTTAADALAHELGHNFGRAHAAVDPNNSDPSSLTSYTTSVEYGDVSCVMGFSGVGLRDFNVPNRIHLDWIPPSVIAYPAMNVSCATSAQQFTLASAQFPTDGTFGYHAIQIPRAKGGNYYVSYRAGTQGYDVNVPTAWKGLVYLHYAASETARTKFVKSMKAGTSFNDIATSFSVRVLNITASSASVEVLCGAMSAANCNLAVTAPKQTAINGAYIPTSPIGGYSAWMRSDFNAVIAYCVTNDYWTIALQNQSTSSSSSSAFDACKDPHYVSASQDFLSPTDVTYWFYCASSSACLQDSGAMVVVSNCSSAQTTAGGTFSPSPSPASTSVSVSVTKTRSASASVTKTRSASASRTASASISSQSSASGSKSGSLSPSVSQTSVPSSSASTSPTPSTSGSQSSSMIPSASLSSVASASSSSSTSVSTTASLSSSNSASATPTSSSSATPSSSLSQLPSSTASQTGTPSASPSLIPSTSLSQSRSASQSKSASVTPSKSSVPSQSRSSSSSQTPSVSPSCSVSQTQTVSPSLSPSETASSSPSPSPSSKPAMCMYFTSLCALCVQMPYEICPYFSDLCVVCT